MEGLTGLSSKRTVPRRVTLTLLAGVRIPGEHLHIVGGEQPGVAVDFSFPPVGVVLVQDIDDLIFGEAHLVLIGSGVIVYSDHLTD